MLLISSNKLYNSSIMGFVYKNLDRYDESLATNTYYRTPIISLPMELLELSKLKLDIPEWKNICYKQLDEIELLKDNWNGNGATKFSNSLTRKVRNLLNDLDSKIELFPTANNSIQIECTNLNNDYIEFEIFEDNVKMFLLKRNGDNKTSYINTDEIKLFLRDFYA